MGSLKTGAPQAHSQTYQTLLSTTGKSHAASASDAETHTAWVLADVQGQGNIFLAAVRFAHAPLFHKCGLAQACAMSVVSDKQVQRGWPVIRSR